MRGLIAGLYEDWISLDERVESLSGEIDQIGEKETDCRRLKSIPGVGPLISTAVVAAIGTGETSAHGWSCAKGAAAWCARIAKAIRAVMSGRPLASILLHCGTERQPQPHRCEPEAAQQQEGRAVADPLRDPAAKRGAQACADALHGDDGALAEIDAAGAVKRARHHWRNTPTNGPMPDCMSAMKKLTA